VASNPSTKPPKLTESGLARELGVSRQAIHDLVKREILSKDKDGLIDVEMAKIALMNRVRPSSKTSAALTPADMPAVTVPAATESGESTEITSYHVAKTLREAAEAQMARIKLGEMQGKYLEKAEVDSAIFEIARALRDGLTNCARRIAADVAALGSAEDCEAVIDREHRALLDSMTHRITSKLGASMAGGAA
jgi:hypothetical protein